MTLCKTRQLLAAGLLFVLPAGTALAQDTASQALWLETTNSVPAASPARTVDVPIRVAAPAASADAVHDATTVPAQIATQRNTSNPAPQVRRSPSATDAASDETTVPLSEMRRRPGIPPAPPVALRPNMPD